MRKVDIAGVFVFQLFQAAARAAVAQAFPFGVGHFFQRLGFPEKTLLPRSRLGCCSHVSQWFRLSVRRPDGVAATRCEVRCLQGTGARSGTWLAVSINILAAPLVCGLRSGTK